MDLTITPTSAPLSLSDTLRRDIPSHDASSLADKQLFASVLSRAKDEQHADDAVIRSRRAAEDFVAQALVEPVLKQMRETTHAEAPFKPNQAEKSFRTMLDSALAQRVVRSGNWKLVDKVAERIMGRPVQDNPAGTPPAPPTPATPTTRTIPTTFIPLAVPVAAPFPLEVRS